MLEAACLLALTPGVRAASTEVLRVGLQATGTFGWVLHAMQHYGLDHAHGLRLRASDAANKAAARVALASGSVDIMIDDFVGVQVLRNNGLPVHAIYPYSKATGGVVVRADAPIESVSDLRRRRIGVPAVNDKSYLILRALAIALHGFDPDADGEVLMAAPPLMESLLARGDLDAALPYWHFVARMTAAGRYRELISGTHMLAQLGLDDTLPLLLVVARGDLEPALATRFIEALRATTARMREDDAIWHRLLEAGLYTLDDASLLPAVRARWAAGVPDGWSAQGAAPLVALTRQLVQVAGPEVVGVASVDPAAYATELAP